MIRVASTGNADAERIDRVPIRQSPGQGQVVMSLARGKDADTSLPDLKPGDQLAVLAELEVTTDLTNAEFKANGYEGCAGQPYDYTPRVTARVVLAADEDQAAPAPGTSAIATRTIDVDHELHHWVIVFTGSTITVPSSWTGKGAVNLTLQATAPGAGAGQCLLVGQNQPDGTVGTDMGQLSVRRIRGQLALPQPTRNSTLRTTALGIHGDQPPRVLYSLPLKGLVANEQLTIYGRVLASAAGLPTRARLSTRAFLADESQQIAPQDGYAARIASYKGHVSKNNGFNHLPSGPVVPAEKVGVLRVLETMKPSKTVYLNLVGVAGDPSKKSRASDQLKLQSGGFIQIRRFAAESCG